MTTMSVTREQVWPAFRRRADVRRRERSQAILLRMDGKSGPEVAQGLYRDQATRRTWGYARNEAGRRGVERGTIPGRAR